MWHRTSALIIKEFLALLKDRRTRTVIIIPPIFQLFVFGYAATYDLKEIPFAIFNEDRGKPSRELIAKVRGSPQFKHVATVQTGMQGQRLIENREVRMVLHIGPRFTEHLMTGTSAQVQVILDGRASNSAQGILAYLQQIVGDFNSRWTRNGDFTKPPARLNIRAWFNPNLESRWFIVPGIVALLSLVVTILVTGLSVAREREAGTFDQLLVTPLTHFEILIGKALPGILIGLVEGSFIILMAVLWFDIPLRGSLLGLYLGLFLFILAATGVGLMISSLSVTQQQGLLGAFLFIVPSIILSGFATPIANMPPWIQTLTWLNPMRHFLEILRSVFLEGGRTDMFWPQYWPMAVMGMVNLIGAAYLFRRRLH